MGSLSWLYGRMRSFLLLLFILFTAAPATEEDLRWENCRKPYEFLKARCLARCDPDDYYGKCSMACDQGVGMWRGRCARGSGSIHPITDDTWADYIRYIG